METSIGIKFLTFQNSKPMKILTNKLLLPVVLPVIILGCGREEQTTENEPYAHEHVHHTISLTEAQVAAAGITLGAIEKKEVFEKVKANGYFDAPPQNKAQVSTYYAGYVKKTTLLIGDSVKKGQVIAILENPGYIRLQQNFMEVNGQLAYLKVEYDRKKMLQAENIAAEKSLLQAEANYKSALATHTGLKKELQMMGFNINHILEGKYTPYMALHAPISGTVTAVNMVIGKYVSPNEVLLEIIDTDHLHVELNIFEKDVLKIKEGQIIHLRIPSVDDEIYEGYVYLVGKAFDEEKRTINVHGHVSDERHVFIPGTYVEAEILIKSVEINALPERAVVSAAGKAYIFTAIDKKDGDRQYQRIAVETGLRSDGWIEVKPADESSLAGNLVIDGAYLLSSGLEEKSHHH